MEGLHENKGEQSETWSILISAVLQFKFTSSRTLNMYPQQERNPKGVKVGSREVERIFKDVTRPFGLPKGHGM